MFLLYLFNICWRYLVFLNIFCLELYGFFILRVLVVVGISCISLIVFIEFLVDGLKFDFCLIIEWISLGFSW